MTTHAMHCDHFNDRLMAYLEHEMDDASRLAMERHAATCSDCGPLLADLRKLRVDAAHLPELAPSRDLWAGIARRIETPVVSIADGQPKRSPIFAGGTWGKRALFAASLVAAVGVGYFLAGTRTEIASPDLVPQDIATVPIRVDSASTPDSTPAAVPPQQLATNTPPQSTQSTQRPTSTTVAATTDVQLVIAEVTADYDREIARLRLLINQRRNEIDPVTVAIIEKNMAVIDTAITQSKQAIARDPASRFLIESLNQSLQTKVELLRTAALLPSRT